MLTPEQILRLPAGRDLDAVVAELRGDLGYDEIPYFCDGNGVWHTIRTANPHSTDWQHAGSLLEEMLAVRYQVTFAPLGPCGVYKFVCWLKKDGVLPFKEIRVHTAQEGTAKAYAIWRLGQQEGATG